jgi:hypothetical protein
MPVLGSDRALPVRTRVAREVGEQLQLALAAERAGVRPAGVGPDERRLRDRAAAERHVDRLGVGGELARDAGARERLEDGRARARQPGVAPAG